MIELELDDIFSAELADSATYAPVIDDPVHTESVSCKVIVERDVMVQGSDTEAEVVEVGTSLSVPFSDVATPHKGSTFTTTDSIFTVVRVQDNNKIVVKAVVTEEAIV